MTVVYSPVRRQSIVNDSKSAVSIVIKMMAEDESF